MKTKVKECLIKMLSEAKLGTDKYECILISIVIARIISENHKIPEISVREKIKKEYEFTKHDISKILLKSGIIYELYGITPDEGSKLSYRDLVNFLSIEHHDLGDRKKGIEEVYSKYLVQKYRKCNDDFEAKFGSPVETQSNLEIDSIIQSIKNNYIQEAYNCFLNFIDANNNKVENLIVHSKLWNNILDIIKLCKTFCDNDEKLSDAQKCFVRIPLALLDSHNGNCKKSLGIANEIHLLSNRIQGDEKEIIIFLVYILQAEIYRNIGDYQKSIQSSSMAEEKSKLIRVNGEDSYRQNIYKSMAVFSKTLGLMSVEGIASIMATIWNLTTTSLASRDVMTQVPMALKLLSYFVIDNRNEGFESEMSNLFDEYRNWDYLFKFFVVYAFIKAVNSEVIIRIFKVEADPYAYILGGFSTVKDEFISPFNLIEQVNTLLLKIVSLPKELLQKLIQNILSYLFTRCDRILPESDHMNRTRLLLERASFNENFPNELTLSFYQQITLAIYQRIWTNHYNQSNNTILAKALALRHYASWLTREKRYIPAMETLKLLNKLIEGTDFVRYKADVNYDLAEIHLKLYDPRLNTQEYGVISGFCTNARKLYEELKSEKEIKDLERLTVMVKKP